MTVIDQERPVWTHHDAIVNGIRLHYVEAGQGPLVLLLHGFPDFWRSWWYQIPALAAAGFRVIAPDMRGYNLSEKPAGVAAYHIDNLVADTVALLRSFGGESGGFLVGHDWGGVVAWYTANRHPEFVKKLIVLNAPHPNRYMEVLHASRAQKLKSYYVGMFQIPWLPERLLTMRQGVLIERALRNSGINPANFTPALAGAYRQAIIQPGAATAALNYYRAMTRRMVFHGMKEPALSVPVRTLLLWGTKDVALDNANANRQALLRWVPHLDIETLEASHWVHIDQPAAVNARIIAFLRNATEQPS